MTMYRRNVLHTVLFVALALLLPAGSATAATSAGNGGAASPARTVPAPTSQAPTSPAPGSTGGTTLDTDSGSDTDSAPITLDPSQIQAMQDAADSQNEDKSIFTKVSDFVTGNAPFFVIGIIVLAAIVAGLLIVRGRSGDGAGPSAAERRRRKRVETQRARQEERLRRKTQRTAGRAGAGIPPMAAYGDPERDPVAAEKAGLGEGRMPGVMPRDAGPIAAPYSPTQTAPASGVVLDPPQSYQAVPPPAPVEVTPAGVPAAPAAPAGVDPAAYEPALESPGLDGTVGQRAAEFAAGAATGATAASIAGRARSVSPGDAPAAEVPEPAVEAAPAADDRLRSTIDDLRGAQPAGATAAGPHPSEPEDSELSLGLAAAERRLSEQRQDRDRLLQEAEHRLRRVEQRAEDAERRAAFAEHLTRLKLEEADREERLRGVISEIERAEQRVEDAESRARAAELSAAAAIDRPVPDPPVSGLPDEPVSAAPRSAREPSDEPAAKPAPAPAGEAASASDAGPGEGRPESPPEDRPAAEPAGGRKDEGLVNLNQATFEQLRELGLSVTQATRILAYRERFGGYGSVDDLDRVPGFSPEKIESMRSRFTA